MSFRTPFYDFNFSSSSRSCKFWWVFVNPCQNNSLLGQLIQLFSSALASSSERTQFNELHKTIIFHTDTLSMISRRLHLPQCPARQWPHHRVLAVRPLTTRAKKDGSSASSTSLDLRSSSSSSQSSPSLYQKLFSKGGDSEPANPRFVRRSRASSQEPSETPHPGRSRSAQKTDNKEKSVLPLGDELRAWFENAVEEEKKSKDPDAGATVLVLNNASRSLVESDFYRLAPQGKHVEGWAGGITKGLSFHSILTDTN